MAQVLPQTTVITETKHGEITINLVLTLKIEAGNLVVSSAEATTEPIRPMVPKKTFVVDDNDEIDWEIPDIKSEGIINFGKEVEDERS